MKIQRLLFVSAALLMGLGVVGLFAPGEIAGLLGTAAPATDPVLFQLLSGALFALGMLDWMNRHATIGGIYGRPVVVANLAFFFISTTTLVRVALAGSGSVALWAFTTACGVLAALYARRFFRSG